MKLRPKNWSDFQQYKDRKPQWIKFHRDLLNDFVYSSVQIGTKATLPLLWLLACEYEDGVIEASLDEIAFRIHIDKKTIKSAIDELLEKGFFTDESDDVQECTELYKSVPREEKRREQPKGVSEYDLFIDTLKSKVSKKSKVTKTKDGRQLFKTITDKQKLMEDYIRHQNEKGEYAQRITPFMEDYKPSVAPQRRLRYD